MISSETLVKRNPEIAALLYTQVHEELKDNFERQSKLLQLKNEQLEEEVKYLRSQSVFEKDLYVMDLKKQNIEMIREYEERLAEKF